MKQSSSGNTRTYKEVRDAFAKGQMPSEITDCSLFVSYGAKEKGIEFPAGQAAFVKACEEGLKAKKG